MEAYQRMRNEVVGVTAANDVGRRKLRGYLWQLDRTEAKFANANVSFNWADAFQPRRKFGTRRGSCSCHLV